MYAYPMGNMSKFTINCKPYYLELQVKPKECYFNMPSNVPTGVSFTGDLSFGLNEAGEVEYCKNWKFFDRRLYIDYVYKENSPLRILDRHLFPDRKPTVFHTKCRNLPFPYWPSISCYGQKTLDVLTCQG